MKTLWYRPHLRNGLTHGLAFMLAFVSTLYINHQFNQELNACNAVSAIKNPVSKKATEKRCNKLFENLDKDLDPWVYILLGFNTYLLMYGWTSGNVSVLTAMETKPDENFFEIKKPHFLNQELFIFGFHFAKVLKSQTQLVDKSNHIFYDDFFNLKFTGSIKRDMILSALLASYPYLEEKTQDRIRGILKELTTNSSDRFDVSEVAIQFLIVSGTLGYTPSFQLLKKIAILQTLNSLSSPEMDAIDKGELPASFLNNNFSDQIWKDVFANWTKISEIGKEKDEVVKIYDSLNPKVISNLQSAQTLLDQLFTK
jgi:hypothetical protein